jgi:hypothetical protein
MKLVFKKDDQEEITVVQSCDGIEHAFLYTDMIKVLLKDGALEASVLEGTFSEEERRSIHSMVNEINRETKDAIGASARNEESNGNPAP